ncbi:hypothetical protein Leryth_006995 [Lithospermum erythrorhizon]|nr:hypothetical protein Leryth_006995 [Lithospermum erythrorhizon]
MACPNDNNNNNFPNYPEIPNPNYDPTLPPSSSSRPNMYPTIDTTDLTQNIFLHNFEYYQSTPQTSHYSQTSQYSNSAPETSHYPQLAPEDSQYSPSAPVEDALLTIPGAILHLIDKEYSVELATGDLVVNVLRNGGDTVAVIASVADQVQWPLTKDVAAVKLDDSHYFFSFTTPDEINSKSSDEEVEIESKKKDKKSKKKDKKSDKLENEMLSYGLTFVSKGQEELVKKLEGVLESYSAFSVQKLAAKNEEAEVLEGAVAVAKELSPSDLRSGTKKEVAEERCAAYWTTLAPNVEEYGGAAAKLIAAGSGQLVKGILWCGDVTSDRLKWGDEVLRKRMEPGEKKAHVSPQTLRRIKRVKKMSKMTNKVAAVVLSGALKVSGFFAGSLVNSKLGRKFFSHLPGEVLLASLDGFSKICDAAEVAGKNVMSTSSTVTTGLVHHKYGEDAAKATNEGLDAAGHTIGTAWTVFKLRQALNPKSALKPATFAKAAAEKKVAAAKKDKAKKKAKDTKNGKDTAKDADEGLEASKAIGTAWTVFKFGKALKAKDFK